MGGIPDDGSVGADQAPSYPDVPGFKARSTSRAAAIDIADSVKALQRMVYRAVRAAGRNGLTAHEVAAVLDLPNTTTAPRLSELARKGLIADSGERRFNASRKRAIVWQARAE